MKLSQDQVASVSDSDPCNALKDTSVLRLPVCTLAVLWPLLGFDTQRLVPLLNDLADFTGTQMLLLGPLAVYEFLIMLRYTDQSIDSAVL